MILNGAFHKGLPWLRRCRWPVLWKFVISRFVTSPFYQKFVPSNLRFYPIYNFPNLHFYWIYDSPKKPNLTKLEIRRTGNLTDREFDKPEIRPDWDPRSWTLGATSTAIQAIYQPQITTKSTMKSPIRSNYNLQWPGRTLVKVFIVH